MSERENGEGSVRMHVPVCFVLFFYREIHADVCVCALLVWPGT